jgi:hypothetical protein
MDVRPRLLLREISRQTGLDWTKRADMILVSEGLSDGFRTPEDSLRTSSLFERLLATSKRRVRLRMS